MSDIHQGRKPFSSIHSASRMRLVRQSRGPHSPLEAIKLPAAEGEEPRRAADPSTHVESIILQAGADQHSGRLAPSRSTITLQAGADDGQRDNGQRSPSSDAQSGDRLRKTADGRRWLNRAAAVAAELVCELPAGEAQPSAVASAAGRKLPQAEEPAKAGRDRKRG